MFYHAQMNSLTSRTWARLVGNLDTQTVEHKQLLGTDSELENSVRVGHYGTLTTTTKTGQRRKLRVEEHLRELRTGPN